MPATKRKATKPAPAPLPPKRPRGRPSQPDLPPQDAEFLMIKQVAAILQVSDDTVARLVHGTEDKPPELDSVRIIGSIRIPRDSLNTYIARQTKRAGTGVVSEADQRRLAGVGR